MTWKTEEFLKLVEKCYGSHQVELLRPSLCSLTWKLIMVCYHAYEAKEKLKIFSTDRDSENIKEVIKQIFLQVSESKEASNFLEAQFISEANVIAFAQSLHSTADILAHVIYHGLNFESYTEGHIDENILGLSNVREKLQKLGIDLNILSAIDKFLNSPAFVYLQAYVNTTKHRSLIDSKYSVFLSDMKHGIIISSFEYKGKKWPEKRADDFTTKDFKVINEGIISIGIEMNNFLEQLK